MFDKIFKLFEKEEISEELMPIDIDDYLTQVKLPPDDDRQTLERIHLNSDEDIGVILGKLEKSTLVIIDITPLIKNRDALKRIIEKLKDECVKREYGICRISREIIFVTPASIRINIAV